MRSGKLVGEYTTKNVSVDEIAELMVGRNVNSETSKKPSSPKNVLLKVNNVSYINNFSKTVLNNVSFAVRAGEVVGFARLTAVVVVHEFELAAQDAALRVEALDVELQRLQFRVAEKRRRSGDRQHRADLDRRGGLRVRTACKHRHRGNRGVHQKTSVHVHVSFVVQI